MAKLYEIVESLRDFIEQNEGLEDEQAYKDTLEALEGELDDKVEQWNRAIRTLEAERDAVKAEKEHFDKRQKGLDKEITGMRASLLNYLRYVGKTEAGRTLRAKIVKNGGVIPLVYSVPPEALPKAYRKIKIEADATAIREALAAGKKIKGVELGERGERLNIG